ncbi:MAG TPA: extracellular solute-binding protein [Methylomirabilota bacterium]|jgi:putative spermidine/putrescine transport system substrate-binding protein|nr:extracellular solute-binding protein [Methylomirabilota bacterium]
MATRRSFRRGILVSLVTLALALGGPGLALAQKDFVTYGQPEEGPWKEIFDIFCREHQCRHVDTDMSSAEAITKFLAEKNRPLASSTEVGILFGPLAARQGVALAYKNASWAKLPEWAKDPNGQWFAVYSGVPSFLVNKALVKTVPQSWQDLLKPEYKNAIAINDPRKSGTAVAFLLAATVAHGGGPGNLAPGIEYFKKLFQAGQVKPIAASSANIQKGEVPITIRYDHENLLTRERFKKELELDIVIPADGSLYTPSVIVLNRYTPDPALAQAFADFLLSDRGQLILARAMARPIRVIAGNLDVPPDVRARWLPEEWYRTRVRTVQSWDAFSLDEIRERWTNEVLPR